MGEATDIGVSMVDENANQTIPHYQPSLDSGDTVARQTTSSAKMTRSDYMNSEQFCCFRERLLRLPRQLRDTAGASTERVREFSSELDPADLATRDVFFFSSRRRHTRSDRDWSSDVCSSD